jgi:hypothetical protein
MADYKATAKQWAEVEEWVEGSECAWDHCLIELRDRVETLESSLYNTRVDYLRLSNAVARICPDRNKFFADLIPDQDSSDTNGSDHIGEVNKMVAGSLVERVQTAIKHSYPDDARAAILEVAAWLREQTSVAEALIPVAVRLEREAGK